MLKPDSIISATGEYEKRKCEFAKGVLPGISIFGYAAASMPTLHDFRRSHKVTLGLVASAIFADTFVYDMVVPFLPYQRLRWSIGETEIGLLFGSYAVALLLATPLAGRFTDKQGCKTALLWGLWSLLATTIVYALADGFWGCMTARFFQGAAGAVILVAGLAFVAAVFPQESRGQALGLAMAALSLGTLVGPPAGGLLFAWGGYALPFWFAGGLVAATTLLVALLTQEHSVFKDDGHAASVRRRGASFYATCGAVALGSVVLSLLEPMLPLHLQERLQADPLMIGLLFMAPTVAYGLCSILAGRISDRWGRKRVIICGLLATLIVLPLVALPTAWPTEIALLAMLGCACAFLLAPTLPALADMTERSGSTAFGATYAYFNTAYAVGMMIGPPLGGLLMEQWGFLPALIAVSIGGLCFVPVLWLAEERLAPSQ